MLAADPAVRYWDALGRLDPAAMAACYAPDATFRDPVFDLEGETIGAMWQGLFGRAKDLHVETGPLEVTPDGARGVWHASYTFPTGRFVRNTIRSSFVVGDGHIIQQRDRFSLWKWSGMALGPLGWLLGWTPWLRRKVRRQAARGLTR